MSSLVGKDARSGIVTSCKSPNGLSAKIKGMIGFASPTWPTGARAGRAILTGLAAARAGLLDLQESMPLQGEFHEDDRLRVIYLLSLPPLPHALKLRLDAEQFRIWLRPGTVLGQVLALCWVPRRLCARWFKARRIDAPP